MVLQARSGATGDESILRRYAPDVKLPSKSSEVRFGSVPGKHRAPRSMVLHVFALGGLLFSLLTGGVIAIEAGSASPPAGKVTTDTPASPSSAISSAPMPPVSVTPFPSLSALTPSPTPSPSRDRITILEDEVTALINQERAKAGCDPVRTDERLRTAARAHSADMARHNYFSHTGRDGSDFVRRLARAGYPSSAAAGENIAYGYPTARAVVDGWMNSEGHRRNILNCSAKVTGVGLAYRDSTPYWTQVFGRT